MHRYKEGLGSHGLHLRAMTTSLSVLRASLTYEEVCIFLSSNIYCTFESHRRPSAIRPHLTSFSLPNVAPAGHITSLYPSKKVGEFCSCLLNSSRSVPVIVRMSSPYKNVLTEFYCNNLQIFFKYESGHCSVESLYFKVVEFEGPNYTKELSSSDRNIVVGFHVVKGHTAVVQASDQNEFLPPRTHIFVPGPCQVTGENYRSFLLPACPPGPDRCCGELVSLLQPFLSGKRPGLPALRIRPVFLLRGPCGSGKRTAAHAAARSLGLRMWEVDCLELCGSSPGQAEGKLKFVFTRAKQYSPCIVLLRNIHVLCRDKDGQDDARVVAFFSDELSKLYSEGTGNVGWLVLVLLDEVWEGFGGVPASVGRLFLQLVEVGSLDAATRTAALDWLCRTCCAGLEGGVSLEQVAGQSPGFLLADLAALVVRTIRHRVLRMNRSESSVDTVLLHSEDFQSALDSMLAAYSDAIGAPRIPTVKWEDIGGVATLKEEILQTITMPLRHPEIAASGLKRSGILLFGPPGTGKTLLAKAVATECSLNFLSVKGPELLNMYVGQSEQNVREGEWSQPVELLKPSGLVSWIRWHQNRGRSGDSGGVMDRVVSQLLAEMDGLQKSSHLFVIATTNRPDLIDPALLRPGRFDKLLYVGASEEDSSHLSILQALTRKFNLGSDVHLEQIAKMLPRNLTGADIYSVCSNAWLSAVGSRIKALKSVNSVVINSLVLVKGVCNNLYLAGKQADTQIKKI
ncbi:hypothetical protein PR048_004465 [Dryococelus australis]|uniref:AAA+ ATPase domain-containing protein n=1 Tax=Dryococelus australis TaxID=614101 RepID=A0ABQ9I6L3_9NEOP|nr:hypothetical protein PR048_004465 [Dryococelus australis]